MPTTYRGTVRMGSFPGSSIGSPVLALKASFDPTSATQVLLGTLPKGAIPLNVISLAGTTGGTNPTVDIGSLADDDGFANELDADGFSATGAGALTGVALTANTAVYGKVGASAGTGGTCTVLIQYVMGASITL